jgi:hypothetical protein
MPGFTPGRRWQPGYIPFKKETFGNRVLENVEYIIKGPLFGCRMCGNCLLQATLIRRVPASGTRFMTVPSR